MKECIQCHRCFDDNYSSCPHDSRPLIISQISNLVISGRYILEKRLGKGGMGIVYKANHKFLKSAHAVKVILPDLVQQDESILIRFRQEAVLAASIDHPNVIRVTDFGVENERMPYLVMEFVDGNSLGSFLKPNEPLSLKNAYELFHPLALGVAEAHRRGITHRDLKPENIIVQKDLPLRKAVRVLDFGLAKIKSLESFGSLIQAKTMSVVGSPPYMSPEQWENDEVDHFTDIYSVGVILFQMLTGHLPFQGNTIPSVMYQHLMAPTPAFASHGISLSYEIEAVVRKALEKKREDRYDSMEKMLGDFENALVKSGVLTSVSSNTSFIPQAFPSSPDNLKTVFVEETSQLTESQKQKLFSYFDSVEKPDLLADQQLAQEFLQAQNRAEEAKVKANQADKLVHELAEAQRLAEEAQRKAVEAKQQVEIDVRRQVEAEMENKRAAELQERQKAEARRLAEEADARRRAEERANYLAQAALEAQKLAEQERKKWEKEARQRELEEGVRRKAEIALSELTEQAADSKKKYEEAQKVAANEAELRRIAEAKRQKIEDDLQYVAKNEAERRKTVEAEARKQIKEQADRFEKEALAAQKRIEEARQLVELEARKREQAEAAQRHAEEEARRLAEEMIEVQRHIEEIKQHTTADHQQKTVSSTDFHSSEAPPNYNSASKDSSSGLGDQTLQMRQTDSVAPQETVEIKMPISTEIPAHLLSTSSIPKRKVSVPLIAAGLSLGFFVLAAGGFGISYLISGNSKTVDPPVLTKNTESDANVSVNANNSQTVLKRVLIQGGSFKMGRSDVPRNDIDFGNQFPEHEESVKSFYIDKTETTNEEYAEFVREKGYPPPEDWKNGKPPAGQEKYPVTFVSVTDAKEYAKWVSEREKKTCQLPTEEEWEFAARNGQQQTAFPWGNDWSPDASNVTKGKVSEVGTWSDETLNKDVKDMLGNVAEWTSSKYSLYDQHPEKPNEDKNAFKDSFVVRGMHYGKSETIPKNNLWMLTRRRNTKANIKSEYLGFRLVCDKP